MKESLRRTILFAVIVVTGSVMILFDVPLILMIPLILVVGFIILLLLGAITVAEIKSFLSRKPENLKKTAPPEKKTPSPPKAVEPKKSAAQKTGIGTHISSFFTSIGSLGTILKERSKQGKKVGDINKQLDKTVSEKVMGSALTSAGNGVDTTPPQPGSGAGPGLQEPVKDQDPFLSLSGDEFDVSLLEGLDDMETSLQSSSEQSLSPDTPAGEPGLIDNEPKISIPSVDISSEAGDILRDNAGGLEEFSGLEGGESIDQEFSDLDALSLDDVDLDVDLDEETPAVPSPSSSPGESPQPSSKAPEGTAVKTAWIPSDAPKDAGILDDEISTQSDMARFSGGASASDEDMLSSLSSDIKHVTKEKDLSLIRDLKDFKATATDIEDELTDMYGRLKTAQNPEKKVVSPPKE